VGTWLEGWGRKAGKTALSKAEAAAFYNSYVNLDLGGFWSTDQNGAVTYLSDNLSAAFSGDGTIGGTLLDIFSSAVSDEEQRAKLSVALARRSQFRNVVVATSDDGERRWWSVSGKAQFNDAQEFTGFLGHCADITQDRSSAE
jgi:PAS domain S-box-containing protein